mmetsp:Transcript_34306/g.81950  ORF Transcript_34306/g.81950 Transcript_34306/m.81950 type:complete len:252 (-) Transcript_34306:53-808(-)
MSISSPNYFEVATAWSEDAASKVFQDPRSVRVLWVRDPLERFLSAFLNKCVNNDNHDYPAQCPFERTAQPPGFPLSQAQSWLRAGGVLVDGHFALQSSHCELRNRLHEYNVIGLMTHSDFAKNAECILAQAGLSYLNKRADGKPFFSHPVNAGKREFASQEILKKFFTKEFAYQLLELYKDDYRLFRLKPPTWVHEATGEWFNSPMGDPKEASRFSGLVHSPKKASPDEDWEAEDDLVAAVERAGFYLAGV